MTAEIAAFILLMTAPVAYIVVIGLHEIYIARPREMKKREMERKRQEYYAQWSEKQHE